MLHASPAHRNWTHWGRLTHICIGNLTIIGPDNGLSPGRRQAIIWTNAGILLIGPWGTNFSEILIGIHAFSLKKIHLKMSSAKWRSFCLGLNVLSEAQSTSMYVEFAIYTFKITVTSSRGQWVNTNPYQCALWYHINTLSLRQNGRYFVDDISKAFSWMKKYIWISIKKQLTEVCS